MRRHFKHLGVALGVAILPLLSACEDPTRPGLDDGERPAGATGASADISAEIEGPASIGSLETCSWFARIGEVHGPYSIEWYRRDAGDGSWTLVERLPIYGGGLDGYATFELRLEVRNAENRLASATLTVRSGQKNGCVSEAENT